MESTTEVEKMKKNILTILALSLISTALISASPMAADLVGLKIENNSDHYVTLRLDGPQFYYLMVAPHDSRYFTIERGDYDYQKYYSCGTFVNTTIDFTKKQTIVVPDCGENAYKAPSNNTPAIDGGKLLKLVKVTLENPYDFNILLILRGPSVHVFLIEAGNSENYTIAKGKYEVTQYGCQALKYWNFYPYANKIKELSCKIH
jgi:hypothetical protein